MRYFFNLVDGERDLDDLGLELPDIEAARLEAVRYAGEVLSDQPNKLWEHGQWRVEVTDGQGILCCTVITLAVDAPSAHQQSGKVSGKSN